MLVKLNRQICYFKVRLGLVFHYSKKILRNKSMLGLKIVLPVSFENKVNSFTTPIHSAVYLSTRALLSR